MELRCDPEREQDPGAEANLSVQKELTDKLLKTDQVTDLLNITNVGKNGYKGHDIICFFLEEDHFYPYKIYEYNPNSQMHPIERAFNIKSDGIKSFYRRKATQLAYFQRAMALFNLAESDCVPLMEKINYFGLVMMTLNEIRITKKINVEKLYKETEKKYNSILNIFEDEDVMNEEIDDYYQRKTESYWFTKENNLRKN
jgi:hypothetical protein